MAKLRVYAACIDGVHDEMIATTSKVKAAKMMQTSVYQLENYGLDFGTESSEGKLAVSEPGVIFRKKKHSGNWEPKQK